MPLEWLFMLFLLPKSMFCDYPHIPRLSASYKWILEKHCLIGMWWRHSQIFFKFLLFWPSICVFTPKCLQWLFWAGARDRSRELSLSVVFTWASLLPSGFAWWEALVRFWSQEWSPGTLKWDMNILTTTLWHSQTFNFKIEHIFF